MDSGLQKLDEIAKDRKSQLELMKKNKDNSHSMLSEGNYTDPQHFIYELLQNAENVKAREVSFELKEEKLIFSHNSKELFTLADAESICTFGDSQNKSRIDSIGKYGIGFKSVYTITDKPRIQSGKFDFSIIERFIPERNKLASHISNTLFTFPLKEGIYEILLQTFDKVLNNSIIFCNHINKIIIKTSNRDVVYEKKEKDKNLFMYKNHQVIQKYILLKKNVKVEKQNCTIKILLPIEKDKIISIGNEPSLYVFFHTKDITNLNFYIHAPFALATHTREHITEKHNGNSILLNELATLFADNLPYLRDNNFIDVDFLNNIFPYKKDRCDNYIYKIFYEKCLEKIKTENLIPANDGKYTKIGDCIFVGSSELPKLLNKTQLKELFNVNNFITPSITSNVNKDIYNFLKDLGVKDIDLKELLKSLKSGFLQKQNDNWLSKFYKSFIKKDKNNKFNGINYRYDLTEYPIIRTSNNKMEYIRKVFLPVENTKFLAIKDVFIKDKLLLIFFKELGIKEPDESDNVKEIIQKYSQDAVDNKNFKPNLKDFKRILIYLQKHNDYELMEQIKKSYFIYGENEKWHIPTSIYYPTQDLRTLFEGAENGDFLNLKIYKEIISNEEELKEFFKEIGVRFELKISKSANYDNRMYKILKEMRVSSNISSYDYTNYDIKDLEQILSSITKEKSIALWNLLCNIDNKYCEGRLFYYTHNKIQNFSTNFVELLKNTKWLFISDNKYVKPSEITLNELPSYYSRDSILIKHLEWKQDLYTQIEQQGNKIIPNEEWEKIQQERQEKDNEIKELKQELAQYKKPQEEKELIELDNVENVELNVSEYQGQNEIQEIKTRTKNIAFEKEQNETKENKRNQKQDKEVGYWGEQYVKRLLEQEFKNKQNITISNGLKNVEIIDFNDEALGVGADFMVKEDDKVIRYIEVKSTIEVKGTIKISGVQWESARNYGELYWIYVVLNAGDNNAECIKIQDPIKKWKDGELKADPVNIVIKK